MFNNITVKVKHNSDVLEFKNLSVDEADSLVSAIEDLDFIKEVAIVKKKYVEGTYYV